MKYAEVPVEKVNVWSRLNGDCFTDGKKKRRMRWEKSLMAMHPDGKVMHTEETEEGESWGRA